MADSDKGVRQAIVDALGWLCDRIPLKFLLSAMLTGMVISALGLRVLREGLPMWTVVVGNGLCAGYIFL